MWWEGGTEPQPGGVWHGQSTVFCGGWPTCLQAGVFMGSGSPLLLPLLSSFSRMLLGGQVFGLESLPEQCYWT